MSIGGDILEMSRTGIINIPAGVRRDVSCHSKRAEHREACTAAGGAGGRRRRREKYYGLY